MKSHNKKWYDYFGKILEPFDMLGVPISIHYNKGKQFKTAAGGVWSIILYSIMSYIFVYLSIRIFEAKHVEVTETVSDSISNN